MKKFLFLIFFISPFIIFSFKEDSYMFDKISFERYPFFLIKKSVNTFYDFEMLNLSGLIFYKEDFILSFPFYDFKIGNIYTRRDKKMVYYDIREYSSLNYDINLISSKSSTNLFSSLFKNDSLYYIKGFSFFNILTNSESSNYENQIIFKYKRIQTEFFLNNVEKNILVGYYNGLASVRVGTDFFEKIISKFFLYSKNFFLYSKENYNFLRKSFENTTFARYHNFLNLTNFVLELLYENDSLEVSAGILQRFSPQLSFYSNINYLFLQKDYYFAAGLKYIDKNLYVDLMPFSENKFSPSLSFNYLSEHFDFETYFVYGDTLEYYLKSVIKSSFFKNNLNLNLTFLFTGDRELETFITFKIVDASTFLGIRFILDDRVYLIKGGLSWKFLD